MYSKATTSITTFLTTLTLALPALAQIPEHLNGSLDFSYVAPSEIENVDGAGEVEIGRVTAFAQEELWGDDVFSDEWGLATGIRGTYTLFDFDKLAPGDLNLFALEIPVSLISEQLNKWDFNFGVTPGLYSDLDDFDADHVNVHGRAAVRYIFKPQVRLLLGAKYDQAFGEEEVYPYAGLQFSTKNKGVEFDLVYPEPRLAFNPCESAQIFFYGKPVGGFWNATETVGLGGTSDLEVEYSALQGGGGISIEIAYDMWMYISGGMEFERELNTDVEKGAQVLDGDLEDMWFARIGFILK